jgi:hypothetical protein
LLAFFLISDLQLSVGTPKSRTQSTYETLSTGVDPKSFHSNQSQRQTRSSERLDLQHKPNQRNKRKGEGSSILERLADQLADTGRNIGNSLKGALRKSARLSNKQNSSPKKQEEIILIESSDEEEIETPRASQCNQASPVSIIAICAPIF